MGNSESIISTSDSSSSSRGTSSSTFEMIRQMSYESDVFYPEANDSQSKQNMSFESSQSLNRVPDDFPDWRIDDMNPVLLKYMRRSDNSCPNSLKNSAKKLAQLAASQKLPKFVSTFGGSQCIQLHWACLAGWCMCRYQYQPMTPLHLMPHTRLTSSNVMRSSSLSSSSLSPEKSLESDAISSQTIDAYDDETPVHHHGNDNIDDPALQILAKETTV